MQSENLKPCPFCGHSAHIEQRGDPLMSTIYQCDDCGCRLETGEERDYGVEWNRRSEAALSTDAEPFGWTSKHFNEGEEHRKWGRRRENVASYEGYIVQALYAEPVKPAPEKVKEVLARLIDIGSGHDSQYIARTAYDAAEVIEALLLPTAPAVAVKALEPEDPAVYRHWEKDELIAALIAERTLSAQVQDVAGWQPIETAPKDKDVLLAVDHEEGWSYVAQGRWVDGEEDQIDQPGHDAGFVDCDYQCFFPGRSFGPDRSRYEGKQPTHWMPLPASPASKHGDAE